jgi:hypothetical protein
METASSLALLAVTGHMSFQAEWRRLPWINSQ